MLSLNLVVLEAAEVTIEEENAPIGEVANAQNGEEVNAQNGEEIVETDQPEVVATEAEAETDPKEMTENQEEEEDVAEATA